MSTPTSKEINFNELWPNVLSTVRSVINMTRYGHTDTSTWQTRFFGLIFKNKKRIYSFLLFIYIDIYHLCKASPESHAERLYEETKKFLEDHCTSMNKVDHSIFLSVIF
jgi:hypothetical protein